MLTSVYPSVQVEGTRRANVELYERSGDRWSFCEDHFPTRVLDDPPDAVRLWLKQHGCNQGDVVVLILSAETGG